MENNKMLDDNQNAFLPQTLEEAVELLKMYLGKEALENHKGFSQRDFTAYTHHTLGRNLRNDWFLWWYPNHPYEGKWPAEKPALIAYFNEELKIYHADDMSGIIFTSLWLSVNDKPLDLEKQVAVYHRHWKQAGFSDGIPKPRSG